MLADLNTKSHPQARLIALRRMWSIEKMVLDEVVDSPTESNEGEKPKLKIKMIRIKSGDQEEDQLEEIGYKLGTRGNVCQTKLDEDLAQVEEEQKVIDTDYDQVQQTSKEVLSVDQVRNIAERFEGILMRQIRLEQRKASIYERAYTEELLLRVRAVEYLRRHEKTRFGKVNDITEMREGEKEPVMTIPGTPEELFTRNKAKEELPWYWKEDDDARVPRTPPYEVYQQQTSSSSKDKDTIPEDEVSNDEGPMTKRVKTPPKDTEEESQRRIQEWKDAADKDRKLAELWKPQEITEEGQRQAEEAFRRGEQWK
jgi:hypothetical protein